MEPGAILAAARDGLAVMAERFARLVEDVADTSIPIPGSVWSVREAAVHTAGGGHLFAAMARGDASPVPERLDKEYLDGRMRSLIADNPETDPKKLADQIRDGYAAFLEATTVAPADQPVAYHAGLRSTLCRVASIVLGEPVLHGYDIAAAVGVPWPIDPGYAAQVLNGYRVFYPTPQLFRPDGAAGLEATYRVEIGGVDPFCLRIADGSYEQLLGSPDADCVISADPVTALLVISGRVGQWPAIAAGRLRFTGRCAAVGPRFSDLFVFP